MLEILICEQAQPESYILFRNTVKTCKIMNELIYEKVKDMLSGLCEIINWSQFEISKPYIDTELIRQKIIKHYMKYGEENIYNPHRYTIEIDNLRNQYPDTYEIYINEFSQIGQTCLAGVDRHVSEYGKERKYTYFIDYFYSTKCLRYIVDHLEIMLFPETEIQESKETTDHSILLKALSKYISGINSIGFTSIIEHHSLPKDGTPRANWIGKPADAHRFATFLEMKLPDFNKCFSLSTGKQLRHNDKNETDSPIIAILKDHFKK